MMDTSLLDFGFQMNYTFKNKKRKKFLLPWFQRFEGSDGLCNM